MSAALDQLHRSVEEHAPEVPEKTRRTFVAGAAGVLGGMGLIGTLPASAVANGSHGKKIKNPNNAPQNILNVAATAEVLATIVNTVGWERGLGGDAVTQRNIAAAAREELIHYKVLVRQLGAKPLTTKIWVPDAVFASRTGLLNTLVAGDQIFVNAYLIGVAAFAKVDPKLAAVPAEFMGVEAVHRALALQSLGQLGNDRVFMRVDFTDINVAVAQLQAAGFGFGAEGAKPGKFYDFQEVRKRTPKVPELNTRTITPIDA